MLKYKDVVGLFIETPISFQILYECNDILHLPQAICYPYVLRNLTRASVCENHLHFSNKNSVVAAMVVCLDH